MMQQNKRFFVAMTFCMLWLASFAQQKVSGHVTDATGEPLIGVSVTIKGTSTGTVASVSGKTIASAPVADLSQALQGKLAGVNIVSQDGRPDATISIRVRGGGSISQSNEPLILIDGIAGSMSDIPADQVESIDVLKDAFLCLTE
jgi:outer membrane receptor protein involved in Fe transport